MKPNIFFLGSLSTIKQLLELDTKDSTNYEPLLRQMMTDVTYQMEKEMNRKVQKAVYTEQYDFNYYQKTLHITASPVDITQPFSLWIDISRQFGPETLISPSSYFVDSQIGLIQFDYPRYACGPGIAKVSYTGGMADTTENFIASYPDVAGAFVTEVAYRWQNSKTVGKASVSVAGASVSLNTGGLFLDLVQQVLDKHIR